MKWPYCRCGTILDATDSGHIKCSACGFETHFSKIHIHEHVTRSAPTVKPTWLQDDEEEVDVDEAEETAIREKYAVIEEPCPKCGHPEQYFYTMQLRSVDEGSTVFYECPNCLNKYSVNN